MKRTSVDEVLAATQATLLALGVRRTTFAEVARQAGLSRATLYTHFPDVETAIAAVLTRELGALLRSADADLLATPRTRDGRSGSDVGVIDHPHGMVCARDRLLTTIGCVLAELPDHPLFATVLAIDADLLLPYVVQRLGTVQRMALQLIEAAIAAGHADGSIRPGDPATLATTVLLAVQAVLLSDAVPEVADRRADVHTTLITTIDRGLRP